MKPGAGIVSLLLGLALLPAVLTAEASAEPVKPSKTKMQQQLNRLIRAEAGLVVTGPVVVAKGAGPEAVAEETLELEPMIIEEQKLEELPPPETKAEKFFRTGTVWKKVGPKFTRQFWVGRGRGIGFTLSW